MLKAKNIFLYPFPVLLICVFICFVFVKSYAQQIPIGGWQHHLPNNEIVSVDQAGNIIYAATEYGILKYDKDFNSIEKIDKVDGLSDFGIKIIRYDEQRDYLLVGYDNGTIDIVSGNQFMAVTDIEQSNILGSKSVNQFLISGTRNYISTGFGVVVFDMEQFIILDTWFIGPEGSMLNVHEFLQWEDNYYAATEAGLLKAERNAPNLADFQYWQPVEGLPPGEYYDIDQVGNNLITRMTANGSDTIYYHNGSQWNILNPSGMDDFFQPKTGIRESNNKLIITSRGQTLIFDASLNLTEDIRSYDNQSSQSLDAFFDSEGILWIGDRRNALIKRPAGGEFEIINPESPRTNEAFGLAHADNTLWVAPGAVLNGFQNAWNDRGVFVYDQKEWKWFVKWFFPDMSNIRDIHHVTIDPGNSSIAYGSAWSGGVLVFDSNEGLTEIYDETNSSLQTRSGVGDIVRVGGTAFDREGNLWVSNSDADHFISVRKTDGTWMSFPHDGLITGNHTLGNIIVDDYNQKWIHMPRGGGLMVFQEETLEQGTSFEVASLGTQEGNGGLPSSITTALAKDKDGYIWVGTNEGVVVFYSPQRALSDQPISAQSIIVVQDGFAGRLFENETINTIFVDGANNKWFGTRNSGAFLLSPDGRETILHFTVDNSPLPSNNIIDITANDDTGEVYFATDLGLVSYRAFATEGGATHSNVYAYPNPVNPGYDGFIAVKGLVANARVKITDIAGNLVYDDFAEGGQFVWDGRDVFGNKPASGVYLVFSTDPQGEETMVTKIMFLK